MDLTKFEDLLERYQNGEISPSEAEELEALLRADPECRRLLVERNLVEANLREIHSGLTHKREEKRTTRRAIRSRYVPSRRSYQTPLFAAATILVCILVLLSLSPSDPHRKGGPSKSRASEAVRRSAEIERILGEEQRRVQERLEEIERQRRELAKREVEPAADRAADEKRKTEMARLEEEKRLAEARMKEAVDRARLAREELARAEKQAQEPERPLRPEITPGPQETLSALVTVERIEGEVHVTTGETTTAARAGQGLVPGQGLTVGPKSRAAIKGLDGTVMELGEGTVMRELADKTRTTKDLGIWVDLRQGTLEAQVVKQPAGRPLVFATPHGQARVLGTTLRLKVSPDETRLEVTEGKVRLTRTADGKTVDVSGGTYAVAAAGAELVSRPLPIDEILLLPRHGRIVGGDWRRRKDDKAIAGEMLEVHQAFTSKPLGKDTIVHLSANHVAFVFEADAEREYFVWIRGCCISADRRRQHDGVVLEVPGGRINSGIGRLEAIGVNLTDVFTGYADREGYWWVGGFADADPGQARPDETSPTSIRFTRPGRQVVRLVATEVPMRIDAIWLSTTQKTRPADSHPGPAIQGK